MRFMKKEKKENKFTEKEIIEMMTGNIVIKNGLECSMVVAK